MKKIPYPIHTPRTYDAPIRFRHIIHAVLVLTSVGVMSYIVARIAFAIQSLIENN